MSAIIHVIHSLFVGFRMDGTVASCGSSQLLAPAAESEAGSVQYAKEAGTKTLIFDKAGLLTREEAEELNALANRLGANADRCHHCYDRQSGSGRRDGAYAKFLR